MAVPVRLCAISRPSASGLRRLRGACRSGGGAAGPYYRPSQGTEAGRKRSRLDPSERERYGLQILSFGEEGQARLKDAHIVVAGASGLGSPVAIYLAVAGVGRLSLIDEDTVALTNLNRQVLHDEVDIGRPKVVSGVETLQALNPSIRIEGVRAMIADENADALIGDANGIVDAMDNYPMRFVLNRVAHARIIPLFHGAIRGFYGQPRPVSRAGAPYSPASSRMSRRARSSPWSA